MNSDDLEILFGSETDADACLEVLNIAYEADRFGQEWLDWKHRQGPWGASRPVLVRSGADDLGAVFALPWDFRINGHTVHGVRFVDGGTTPKARRRGVFKRMIGRELEEWTSAGTEGLLLATATPAAQASHVKNGAVALAPIHYRVGLPRSLRSAQRTTGDGVLDSYSAPVDPFIRTDWSAAALRWRTDPRSGHRYTATSLTSSEAPNGLVYRTVSSRGLRILVPLVEWGAPRERSVLLGSTARAERCPAVLAPADPGAEPVPARWGPNRGEVLVCVWERRAADDRSPASDLVGSWRLTAADVEGLI